MPRPRTVVCREEPQSLAGLLKAGGSHESDMVEPVPPSPRETPSDAHAATQDPATAALFTEVPFARPVAEFAPEHRDLHSASGATTAATPAARADTDLGKISVQEMIAKLRKVLPEPPAQVGRPSDAFVRTEDLAVLESKLKAARPALIADFRSKQRTVLRKAKGIAKGSKRR